MLPSPFFSLCKFPARRSAELRRPTPGRFTRSRLAVRMSATRICGRRVPNRWLGKLRVIDLQRLKKDEAYREEVFTALVRDYQDAIWRYCVTRLGESRGEEVSQDVFVTVWDTLSKLREESTLPAFLFGIAANHCARVFRNHRRRAEIARAFEQDIRDSVHPTQPALPEHVRDKQTLLAQLADSLTKLRSEDRLFINLRYIKGLSVVELANLAGMNEDAVRKRLLRALQRLREVMGDVTAR